jgi:hypothetical protein
MRSKKNKQSLLLKSKTNKDNITKLMSCYYKDYQPPYFSKDNLYKLCKVFYNNVDNLDDIMRLVKEREPVNIAMKRFYYRNKLNKYFGYKYGYYGKCSNSIMDITPPNFIVYTPTKVKNNSKTIHVLNAIGLAFDNIKQVDYKNYMKLSNSKLGISIKHINKCKIFYTKLFHLIFKIALKLKKDNVVMSLVGANNFASLWNGGPEEFKKVVWFPTFNSVIKDYKYLNIMFMGAKIGKYHNLGYFPQCINDPKIKNKLNKTLFINAWDCWSVPGNGNNLDYSLDGYIGRNTQIGIYGTSLTNPYLCDNKNYIGIK